MHEPRFAARFERTPVELARPAPMHAQHTDEVLEELGYDTARRAALRERGAIV
jgi:crotonobetainyl-CoA:carnitine CoA-transferase CaiB-like acyl-CoA transferase